VIIAAIATALIGPVGWRGTFMIAAAIIAFIFAPLAWFVLDRSEGAPARTVPTPAAKGDGAKGFNAMRNPGFWALLAASLPMMVVLYSMMSNLAAIVADSGAAPGRVAMIVSVFQIAAAAGSLVGGWLADRIGLRTVYACIFAGISIPLAILAFAPGLYFMGAALLLMGFAGGSVMPWSGAVVARCFGVAAFARVFGLLIAFFIPASLAPILVGIIHDATGAYHLAFLMLLVLLTPGALSFAFFLRPPTAERVAAAAGA
jgi:MFS family permease